MSEQLMERSDERSLDLHAPASESFAEIGVSKPVVAALEARGIVHPFIIQAMVMRDALAGRDVLAKSRTGSGKTLAFAIPIVEALDPKGARPQALVLVPTRELAAQVTDEMKDIAKAKGLRVAAVYGGVGIRGQAESAKRAHILIATPGRMEDLCNRRLVSLDGVRTLVLDEADRMLDMGFLPQVDRLVKRLTEDRQTMFFSATLDGDVGRVATAWTRDAAVHTVESVNTTVEELEHLFVPVTMEDRTETLVKLLREHDRELALVFTRTKAGADRLARKLKGHGVEAEALHGDMSQRERERALQKFDGGQVDVLVATDVAARGLDLTGITHVVNFDPPEDDKSYVHRVGRTARAGRSGTCVTLVLPDQRGDVSRMAARLKLEEEFKASGMAIAPPRIVYSGSRGRNSLLGKRPRRRF